MLAPGTKLGPYEILAPLGAGGMGEVWRARDSRLGREVAIKVLPQRLASTPEFRARFEREAKTISSLNHPNICTLFDIGEHEGTSYLVMELVEGETLAGRLTRGALPAAEALKIAEQIADAMDRAHRAGIVHRDLKPGNVMITRSGAKLMDFGLARRTLDGSVATSSVMATLTQTPTVASPLTTEGQIVGTFQYMAPEQLEGKEADARSDLWAFGCVLYEMITGRRAFDGKSQASLIAAILERQPEPPSAIAPRTPAALDGFIGRCLAKDPDDRWQSARDLVLELRAMSGAALSGMHSGVVPVRAAPARHPHPFAVGAIAAIAAFVAAFFALSRFQAPNAGARPLVLAAPMPEGVAMSDLGGDVALSPDGRALAMVATDAQGNRALWVRPLGANPAVPLPGTQGASMPFWSPNSRTLGFFANGKMRRIAVAGGTADDICAAATARGGSWGRDDVILFAPGAEGPIYRVAARGGTPEAVTVVDTARHEIGHRFPRFLSDGRRFFYATTPSVERKHEIYLARLGSRDRRLVVRADGVPELSPEGWLVFLANGVLQAQRFDAGTAKLSGSPVTLLPADQGTGIQASPSAWASRSGMLVVLPMIPRNERLAWVDRDGRDRAIEGMPIGGWFGPEAAPDGRHMVVMRAGEEANSSTGVNLWMCDLIRGAASRLTFDNDAVARDAVWTHDSKSVIYSSNKGGAFALYRIPAGGGTAELLGGTSALVMSSTDVTPDDRAVIYETEDPKTGNDVWLLPLDGDRKPRPVVRTEFNERNARVSPDGRWLAYESNQSGRTEIYVEAFPAGGARTQVSTGGGRLPGWRGDGQELFFRGLDDAVFAARVTRGVAFRAEPPVRLFRLRQPDFGYSLTHDGTGRFVLALVDEAVARQAPTVLVNWTALVKEK